MFSAFVALLLAMRATELLIARRNGRWAREQGGVESGARHYPIMVGMHCLFYVSLVAEHHFNPMGWNALWPLWLGILALVEALRVWLILSLGRFWNTRIIVIPGGRRVAKGPYRFVRHPNYVVVTLEILLIPVICGAYLTALAFSIANALVLRTRIREEERALRQLAGPDTNFLPRFVPRIRIHPAASKVRWAKEDASESQPPGPLG
ncbi:MAG TPA: isoprenylcysteine carboxylmethyltransferase family protein [Acidobacteriota bacterium]|nr:isoprenylcysteine carboxylmethyltransferase family protein [Acidobacteriota bacterium]